MPADECASLRDGARPDACGDPRGTRPARRPDPEDAGPAARWDRPSRRRFRARHEADPEARAFPAHRQLQGARRAREHAGTQRSRDEPRHLRDQRRQSRDRGRVCRTRRRHERQSRDESGRESVSRCGVPAVTAAEIEFEPDFHAAFRRVQEIRDTRRADADPSIRGTAHGNGHGHARPRIHGAGAGSRRRHRADRRRRPRRRRFDGNQA